MTGPETRDPRAAETDPGDRPLHPDRIHFALGLGRSGIWNWQAGREDFFGDRGLSLLWGLPVGDSMSLGAFKASVDPDDIGRALSELRRAASIDGPDVCQVEFRIRRPEDGAERWIALEGRRYPAVPGAGEPSEIVGMARDITSRKQRETHMHLLMREVTHRSKNLLAIIQAMARQTVKDSITATEFEQRFSARLRGLAASHDLLAARDWHGANIAELVRWQLAPALDAAGDRIALEGPELYLNPEAAQNIGLALNELSSNAARFGALSNATGHISVTWSIDPVGTDDRRFRLGWSETGGPEVSQPRRTGFGHKVMERLTARALEGRVTLAFPPSGLQWSLEIPTSFVLDAADVPAVN